TVSNSVRMIEPVGHASRHGAFTQCLQTSDMNSHRCPGFAHCSLVVRLPQGSNSADRSPHDSKRDSSNCSTNTTCRHVVAERSRVLSYETPVKWKPSAGRLFHCLHATSHALQPMQSVVSVKKPYARPGVIASRPRVLDPVPCA